MRAQLAALLLVTALLGGWSGVAEADDETPEHFCVPDGAGGWERHDNVSPEEAGDLAARGGFEIDQDSPCPPEEGAGGIGLGNLCKEQPEHPACNPDETKVPNSNEMDDNEGSSVHGLEPPHRHPEPREVEAPVGAETRRGPTAGPGELPRTGLSGWLPFAGGGLMAAAGAIFLVRRVLR